MSAGNIPPGVYIAYPFCEQKCSFCNFASDVGSKSARERYGKALLGELAAYSWTQLPDTLYFGGGTPSLMAPQLLAETIDRVPGDRLTETTIECAPGTFSRDSVRFWRDSGINRVSMGVQSFLPNELRLTGRRHDSETVTDDVKLLRSEGIDNINLDLIAGLPEQTAGSWDLSLDWIERLSPTHVSIYLFETDEDSRLGKELLSSGARYGAGLMPTDELMAELYERAVDRLAQSGWERYEISNFARTGFASKHNLKYWLLAPYVGFGLDAHSFDGVERWSNPDTLPEYFAKGKSGQEKGPTDPAEEHFFVGLRLISGIEPTAAEWTRFAQPIERWSAAGMLERDGSRLRLSQAGVLLSNEIFQEFV